MRPTEEQVRSGARKCLPLPAALAALLLLAGCASPCERINADLRALNAEMIRNPGRLTDGSYAAAFQDLAARSVEHSCLQ